ncbi:MAG: malto-oligosyltrehalose synthase, partial [Burkholderiaceae bacterium]
MLRGKLLAPFLGSGYGEALASGDLVLVFDDEPVAFEARYFDNRFPIAIADYPALLDAADDAGLAEIARLFNAVADLRDLPRNDARERASVLERRDALLDEARRHLRAALGTDGARAALDRMLARHAPSTHEGRARLHALFERQSYRLASWRAAADEINWRRFFEVTDLAGVRVERAEVFDAMHATLFRLYREGVIDAMRVDHVDGLADPRGYCRELRKRLEALAREREAENSASRCASACASPWKRPWIVVEKILASREGLRSEWRVDGTTGYDFMDEVGALLHAPEGAEPLAAFWARATQRPPDFRAEALAARRQILVENLAAEFNAAARALHRVARADIDTRDVALIAIARALTELLVQIDVYRSYVDARGRSAADTTVLVRALHAAHDTVRPSDRTVLAWLDHWLGGDAASDVLPETSTRKQRTERRQAITRFQQLTPPLAAKSIEDTAFYRYGRLISRNEVGSDPGEFALSIDAFHAKCVRRAKSFPHSMLATSTHDHKRGADTRARLAVLSEIPQRWIATLERWLVLNTPIEDRAIVAQDVAAETAPMIPPAGLAAIAHVVAESAPVPLPEDQIMLMQTLIGAWPLALASGIDSDIDFSDESIRKQLADFVERVAGWQTKALRETKRPSDWAMPNEHYEATCRAFLDRIMDPASSPFAREAAAFVESIVAAAALNGLVQATLHLTAPGVPDFYQGTEWWDFSLVDPDNRRPVDYAARNAALNALTDSGDVSELLNPWRDGRIKQALIARLLAFRKERPGLFSRGFHQPVALEGSRSGHALAFVRSDGRDCVLVVVTLHAHALLGDRLLPHVMPDRWQDTAVVLPADATSATWRDIATNRQVRSAAGRIPLADMLADLPVAVLRLSST